MTTALLDAGREGLVLFVAEEDGATGRVELLLLDEENVTLGDQLPALLQIRGFQSWPVNGWRVGMLSLILHQQKSNLAHKGISFGIQ
jgi:hypothetical protein